MARYYKPNYVPLEDLTPKYPVEAYYNLMNQVAQNRANAETAAAKVKEDMYGIKYMDQGAHDYAIGNAEKLIADSLNADFPTQSTMANTLGRASQYIQPFKQLSELQVEKAKQAEMLKIQNPDILINDPANMKIFNPQSKTWANANSIVLDAVNPDIIRKMIDEKEAGFLTSTRERAVKSDIPFYYKILSITGLDDKEKALHYGDAGDRIATLRDMINKEVPNIQRFFGDDPEKAKAYLNNLVRNVTGKYAYKEDAKYLENKAAFYRWTKAQETPPPDTRKPFFPTTGIPVKNTVVAPQLLDYLTGAKPGTTKSLPTVAFNADGSMRNTSINKRSKKEEVTYIDGIPMLKHPEKVETEVVYYDGIPYTYEPSNEFNKDTFLLQQRLGQLRNDKRLPFLKGKTDKEVYDWFMQQSEAYAGSYFNNTGLGLSDYITANGGNPFVDEHGNIKGGGNLSVELRDENTGEWKLTPLSNLSKELGYDSDQNPDFIKEVAGLSSKDFALDDGKVTNRGMLKDANGNVVAVRYSPYNNEVAESLKPSLQISYARTTPGSHQINLNGYAITIDNDVQFDGNGSIGGYVQVSDIKPQYRPRNAEEKKYMNDFYNAVIAHTKRGDVIDFLQEVADNTSVQTGVKSGAFIIDRKPTTKTTIE